VLLLWLCGMYFIWLVDATTLRNSLPLECSKHAILPTIIVHLIVHLVLQECYPQLLQISCYGNWVGVVCIFKSQVIGDCHVPIVHVVSLDGHH
jgi:hypothetical protein